MTATPPQRKPAPLYDAATTTVSRTVEKTPRGYLPSLGIGAFAIYLATLTPALVGLQLKLLSIAGDGAATALSLVASVGALFALVVNPVAGRLSDRTRSRFGRRRPWIIGGAAVGFVALIGIGLATEVWMVLIAWCLAQAGFNAALAAITATVPDQVPDAQRGRASGIIGVGTPLAILVGSTAVALLPTDLLRFGVPAIVALVGCAIFALLLRDRRAQSNEGTPFTWREFFGSFVFNPRRNPDFGWNWINRFLMFFGYTGINTYLAYYLTDDFGVAGDQLANVMLVANVFSVAGMVVASMLGGWLSDRFHMRRPFVTIAGLIMVVGLLVLAFAPSLGVVYAAQLVVGLGFGSYLAVDLALATSVLPNEADRAKDLGVLNIANALPQSVAPAIAPAVLAFGSALPIGGYSTWFLLGAVVAAIGSVLVYRIKGVR
ncbi:MFS transporter [Microbacterium indicum]|uniref:MFS transporter n=1 Tax=Microbacterium indicum TaxID=358100 RepID=UPI00041F833E|nr:MFS transporter [Microbacterium indicum]